MMTEAATSADDLGDVKLDGRTLVTDDPTEWIIPRSLKHAIGAGPVRRGLLVWVEEMRRGDDVLRQRKLHTRAKTITDLADRLADLLDRAPLPLQQALETRQCVLEILGYGLTLRETAALIGITPTAVLAHLYTMASYPLDLELRLEAADLLYQGELSRREIARRTGLSVDAVSTLGRLLGIAARPPGRPRKAA